MSLGRHLSARQRALDQAGLFSEPSRGVEVTESMIKVNTARDANE